MKSFSSYIQLLLLPICTWNELTKIIMVISWCTKCKHTSFKIDEVAWHLSRLKIIFSFSPPVSTFHLNGKNKCYVISVNYTKHRAVLKKKRFNFSYFLAGSIWSSKVISLRMLSLACLFLLDNFSSQNKLSLFILLGTKSLKMGQ